MSEFEKDVALNATKKRPTLKQLATVLECPMERLRTIAKRPIVGEAYDPKAINWQAVDGFIINRLEKTGYDALVDVYEAAREVEIAAPARSAGSTVEMLDIEGVETTPKRKFEVAVGDKIVEKKKDLVYEVLYVDETIVVFRPISEDGKLTLSRSIGNRNFNGRFTVVKAGE